MDTSNISKALSFATRKHAGQKRLSGEPYVEHVKRVSALVQQAGFDEEVQVAALLHDTLEDTETTLAELNAEFGEQIASFVQALTQWQRPAQSPKSELERQLTLCSLLGGSCLNSAVLAIKIADQYDNLTDVDALSEEQIKRKREEVQTYFLPIYRNFPTLQNQDQVFQDSYKCLLAQLVQVLMAKNHPQPTL